MSSEPSTVAEVLRIQARSRGDRPLLICDSERISYVEADRLSGLLARRLIGLGAGKGSHVGLLYPNGVTFVIGMLAERESAPSSCRSPPSSPGAQLRAQPVDSDTEILLAAASFRSHDYLQQLTAPLPGSDLNGDDPLFDVAAPQSRTR